MSQKKTTRIYRTNLVNVGIGQGQMEAVPYLLNITEFNRNGLTSSRSNYSAEEMLTEKITWAYDENGQVISEDYYTDEDEPSEKITFERDGKGQVIKDKKKYLDGSEDITTYSYDENDRLTGKLTIDDEGNTYSREEFIWNEKNLISHVVTDGENNQIEKDEFIYDDNGNVLEHKRMNEETGENFKTVSKYNDSNQKTSEKIFDENNVLIESTVFKTDKNGKPLSSTTESPQKKSSTHYFYDEKGNNLGQQETDQEGNQVLWVEHTYDEQNNLNNTLVFINGGMVSRSQHYELNYEYEWYDEE